MAQMVNVCLQCGRPRFSPLVGKISWRRKWQSTALFLLGKCHGWRNLVNWSPWGNPGKNTGMGSHSLLQGLFLTQGSNQGLLHCRQILHCGPPGKPQLGKVGYKTEVYSGEAYGKVSRVRAGLEFLICDFILACGQVLSPDKGA